MRTLSYNALVYRILHLCRTSINRAYVRSALDFYSTVGLEVLTYDALWDIYITLEGR